MVISHPSQQEMNDHQVSGMYQQHPLQARDKQGAWGPQHPHGHSVEDLKDNEENEARRGKAHQPGRFLRTVPDKLYFSSGSHLKEGRISPTLFCTCPTLSLEEP